MTLSTLSLLALHCFSSYKSSNLLFVSDICKMLHALWNALFYVFVCIGNVAGSYSFVIFLILFQICKQHVCFVLITCSLCYLQHLFAYLFHLLLCTVILGYFSGDVD